VIGASSGAIGTAVAQQHLRSLLSFCNAPQMNAPEAYIHFTPGLITDDGQVTVARTEEFLRTYMMQFLDFIERVYMALPRQRPEAAAILARPSDAAPRHAEPN
jgi:chromate reductase